MWIMIGTKDVGAETYMARNWSLKHDHDKFRRALLFLHDDIYKVTYEDLELIYSQIPTLLIQCDIVERSIDEPSISISSRVKIFKGVVISSVSKVCAARDQLEKSANENVNNK